MSTVAVVTRQAGSMLWEVCPFCWLPFACFHDGCGPDCPWRDCWGCSDPDLGGWTVATALSFLAPRLPGGPLAVQESDFEAGKGPGGREVFFGRPSKKEGGAP